MRYKPLLLSMVLSFFANSVQTMEERIVEVTTPAQSLQVLTKSQKKRNKRKKQNKAFDVINPHKIEQFIKSGDLKKILNFNCNLIKQKTIYIIKLNLLANMILMQQWTIDSAELIRNDLGAILTKLATEGALCLSIQQDGIGICGHTKDELGEGTTKIISSDKVKEWIRHYTAPLLLTSAGNKEETYKKCCSLLAAIKADDKENYSDALAFNLFTKRLLQYHSLQNHVKSFENSGHALNAKIISNLCSASEAVSFGINENSEYEEIIKILLTKLGTSQEEILPFFISLQERIYNFHCLFKKITPTITLKEGSKSYISITNILEWWAPVKELYKIAYKKIMDEIENTLSTIPSYSPNRAGIAELARLVFLYPPLQKSQNLPPSLVDDSSVKESSNKADYSYITTAVQVKKNMSPLSQKKKKPRKRKNRRPHKPEEPQPEILKVEECNKSEKETQTPEPTSVLHIKFPLYADRIINRFSMPQDIEDLYHTYSPVADGFIIKYGSMQKRRNRTYIDKVDTKYTMNGTIEYENGDILYVEFSITLNENHICYHREFLVPTEKEQSQELSNLKFESNFPTLISHEDAYVAARLQFVAHNDEIYGKKTFSENSKTIVIKDTRNSVILTLFKTQNDNTID